MSQRGEIRHRLTQTYAEHAALGAPIAWRDAAATCGVGFDAARRTTENMVRAGELQACGARLTPRGNTREHLYAPAGRADSAWRNGLLVDVVHLWLNFR